MMERTRGFWFALAALILGASVAWAAFLEVLAPVSSSQTVQSAPRAVGTHDPQIAKKRAEAPPPAPRQLVTGGLVKPVPFAPVAGLPGVGPAPEPASTGPSVTPPNSQPANTSGAPATGLAAVRVVKVKAVAPPQSEPELSEHGLTARDEPITSDRRELGDRDERDDRGSRAQIAPEASPQTYALPRATLENNRLERTPRVDRPRFEQPQSERHRPELRQRAERPGPRRDRRQSLGLGW